MCSVGFSIVKYYYKLAFLRVKTRKRAWEAVFNVRRLVTTYIEVGGGGWGGGEQIWLFSLCGCLELSDY